MMARSIRFDDELYHTYVDAARERNVSFNWLIHKVLEENIERIRDAELFRVTV